MVRLPQSTESELKARRALRQLTVVSMAAVFLLVGVFGTWAVSTEISGAVVADGRIVVESSPKTVQHREGGIVRDILVRNGDTVAAGQPLVLLDDTMARAELGVIQQRLVRLIAKSARLTADAEGKDRLDAPTSWHGLERHADIASAMAFEQQLLTSLHTARDVEKSKLRQKKAELEADARGYTSEKTAAERQLDIVNHELEGLLSLQSRGMATTKDVSERQRNAADLEGRIGSLNGRIASTGEQIHQAELAIVSLEETARSKALGERQDNDTEILELLEKRHAAQDALNRTRILAPRAGTVRALTVHTIGGVVGPGDPILTIVPTEDNLVIEARIRPGDVDQLYVGQAANVRFPGLNQRTTPQVEGSVINIDSDLTESQVERTAFYITRIAVDAGVLERAGGIKLAPGMPAQVFVRTTSRTPMSYFLKPLTDQISRVFRES